MKKIRIIFITSIFVLLISFNSFCQKSVSVRVGNILVADRNIGTNVPQGGVALNYTNNTSHADHKNSLFKGDYYTWSEAKTVCPSGWRLPTSDELEVIENKMQLSNETAYLEDGAGNRCYFPFAGSPKYPSYVAGFYWSSTEYDSRNAWRLSVTPGPIIVIFFNKSRGNSVRCVKTVELR